MAPAKTVYGVMEKSGDTEYTSLFEFLNDAMEGETDGTAIAVYKLSHIASCKRSLKLTTMRKARGRNMAKRQK